MSRSLVSRRKRNMAICLKCKHPGYTMLMPSYTLGKPRFRCDQCNEIWTFGRDGGIYAKLANKKGRVDNIES